MSHQLCHYGCKLTFISDAEAQEKSRGSSGHYLVPMRNAHSWQLPFHQTNQSELTTGLVGWASAVYDTVIIPGPLPPVTHHPLSADTLSLQVPCLCLCLGRLHASDLLTLSTLQCRLPATQQGTGQSAIQHNHALDLRGPYCREGCKAMVKLCGMHMSALTTSHLVC